MQLQLACVTDAVVQVCAGQALISLQKVYHCMSKSGVASIHKDNSTITALQTQSLAFCTRVWLCKTTITKHLTVGIAVLAHKACGEITALEIHWLVQLTLSSTSYTSQLQLCTFTVPFHIPVQRLEMPKQLHWSTKNQERFSRKDSYFSGGPYVGQMRL